ncbi:hypothetical protein KAJ27_03565 [bacterium]|nr:hypothetical protein [bacterium]
MSLPGTSLAKNSLSVFKSVCYNRYMNSELCKKTQDIIKKMARNTIEETVIELVDSINRLKGLITLESCGGHIDRNIQGMYPVPWVVFTIDDFDYCSQSISLLSVVASIYDWVLMARPGVLVNHHKKIIPTINRSRIVTCNFILVPRKAVLAKKHINEPFFTVEKIDEILEFQKNCDQIAKFIKQNRDEFDFGFSQI